MPQLSGVTTATARAPDLGTIKIEISLIGHPPSALEIRLADVIELGLRKARADAGAITREHIRAAMAEVLLPVISAMDRDELEHGRVRLAAMLAEAFADAAMIHATDALIGVPVGRA
jgi:hypothetical protein